MYICVPGTVAIFLFVHQELWPCLCLCVSGAMAMFSVCELEAMAMFLCVRSCSYMSVCGGSCGCVSVYAF